MISPEKPFRQWYDFMSDQAARDESARGFVFDFEGQTLSYGVRPEMRGAIYTKPKIKPFIRFDLNFRVLGSRECPSTRIETNPNNFQTGFSGLCALVDGTFGCTPGDLRVTRLDLNADVEGVSVQYFREALRIPAKRKSGEISEWKNKGVETFYVGKGKAKLRTYDKMAEQRFRGAEVGDFPPVLTRLEWELHGDRILKNAGLPSEYGVERPRPLLDKAKTQAFYFSELPVLQECRPFRKLDLFDNVHYYDFINEIVPSRARITFEALSLKLGAHDAIRILNHEHHFARDIRPHLVQNTALKDQVELSFNKTITMFFNNESTNVQDIYRREKQNGQGHAGSGSGETIDANPS